MDKAIGKQLSETEAAYLAGLIDGDGSITCGHTSKRVRHRPIVTIHQKDPTILFWVQEVAGVGSVTKRTRGYGYQARYPKADQYMHRWRLTQRVAGIEFLRQVEPYLRIKQEKAKLLINGECTR